MILTVSPKREFTPKWNGNDTLPATEQIKIIHRPASIALKERLFPREFKYGADGQVSGVIVVDRKKIIDAFVIELVNIAYKFDDAKESLKKVKTVADLFDAPPEFDGLIDEMYAYFQELLNTKVDEKN